MPKKTRMFSEEDLWNREKYLHLLGEKQGNFFIDLAKEIII